MDKHISSVEKICFLQLREFCQIRSFIPKSAAITFTNVFIHSRIDYCNSPLFGLSKYSLHRLQLLLVLLHFPLVSHLLLPFSNIYIGYLLNTVLTLNCAA